MLKKIAITSLILLSAFSSLFISHSAFAEDCESVKQQYGENSYQYKTCQDTHSGTNCRYFLGMTSWDCNTGLTNGGNVTEDKLKTGIWTAVANVATDVTVIAAYLVIGYVIYGGYLYIFSGGEPSKTASGKKTLTRAFIGLAIVMTASIIMNAIRIALGANFSADCVTSSACTAPDTMIVSTIQWVVGVAGVVAAIFVVYGGISYTTSAGEPAKLTKAKQIILYALIGLAIVALAEILTAFVSSAIRDAKNNATTSLNIQKEDHEIQIN